MMLTFRNNVTLTKTSGSCRDCRPGAPRRIQYGWHRTCPDKSYETDDRPSNYSINNFCAEPTLRPDDSESNNTLCYTLSIEKTFRVQTSQKVEKFCILLTNMSNKSICGLKHMIMENGRTHKTPPSPSTSF